MRSGRSSLVVTAAAFGLLSLAVADAQIRPVPGRPPPGGGGFNPGLPQRSPETFKTTPSLPPGLGSGLTNPTGAPTPNGLESSDGGQTADTPPIDPSAVEAVVDALVDDYLSRHDLIGGLPVVEKTRTIRRGGT